MVNLKFLGGVLLMASLSQSALANEDYSSHKSSGHHANVSNQFWWPERLDLAPIRQHSEKSSPVGSGFNYAKEFKKLDLKAVKADVQKLMAKKVPSFGATTTAVAIKRDGVVVSVASPARTAITAPTAAPRNGYEFRLDVSRKLYDRAIATLTSPALSSLATGASVCVHSLDLERIGAPEGASVRVSNSHSSIVLPLRVSDSVPRGTAVVPFNQPGADIRELIRHGESVIDVRIESI